MPKIKITYTTLSADDPQLQSEMDAAIERVQSSLGQSFPMLIDGNSVTAQETFPVISPIDTREPLVHFQKGTREHTQQAIAAAKSAFPAWRNTPWEERCALIDKAAEIIDDNVFDMSAMMMLEMGKNRLEALGEVAETSDLMRYYTYQMRKNNGYVQEMESTGPHESNRSVLKPYGVWAVISPFNFPLALGASPVAAALIAGNTVILKPSSDAPWTCYMYAMFLHEAGIPGGAANFITGPGSSAGAELIDNPGVAGITFTGSYDIGFKQVYRNFAPDFPKPVVVEMGGKNPAIVSDKADLEKASLGVMRSAFGLGGQKCSACSRVYVHQNVYATFVEKLVEQTSAFKIGDPVERDTYLGPVANKSAFEDYQRFMDKARADGTVIYGGNVLSDGEKEHGYYVEPAIITDLPEDHELVKTELFLPILFVAKVSSVEEGMRNANDTEYGLTAGIFSEDEEEIEYFFSNIEAGTTYANRPGGATTGAWPGYQPFGGWKGSGSSGRNIGGYYSLLSYLREQSQTIIRNV